MSCGKKQKRTADNDSLVSLSVIELRDLVKRIESGSVPNLSRMTRQQLCDVLHKHSFIGLLKYDGRNSCYFDSTLTSLFHMTNEKWVRGNLVSKSKLLLHYDKPNVYPIYIQIRSALKDIYKSVQHGGVSSGSVCTCSTLRSLVKRFESAYQKDYNVTFDLINWTRTQQEPRDVMDAFTRIFDIKPDLVVTWERFFPNDKASRETTRQVVHFNAPYISPDILKQKRETGMLLSSVFPRMKDILPNGKNEIREFVKGSLVMINVGRNWMDEAKITTIVQPMRRVTLSQQAGPLELMSIIIHHGRSTASGHYTCLIKRDRTWYHYDDMKPILKIVGTFSDMLAWENRYVLKNSVAYIYCALARSQT